MPPGISKDGAAFLKCAFASPDFGVETSNGIPDQYNGKTFMKPNTLPTALVGGATTLLGKDTYFIVCPMPGIAYLTLVVDSGVVPTSTMSWTQVAHNGNFGTGSLFGDISGTGKRDRSDNVNAYRYAGMWAEVKSTGAPNTTSGSIQVWKSPLHLTTENITISVQSAPEAVTMEMPSQVLNGLDAVQTVPAKAYTGALIDGAYSVSVCNEADFEFKPIQEGINRLPPTFPTSVPPVQTGMFGEIGGPVLGMGEMDAIFIKITSPAGSVNSFQVITGCCVEYRATSDSLFEDLCRHSAAYDPVAIAAYRRIALQLPTAVIAAHNANFWKFVLGLLNTGGNIASYIPGAPGIVGSAVSGLASGLQNLYF